MLKFYSTALLTCVLILSFSDTAVAGSSVNASFTSEPSGVNVVVKKQKSRKVLGECVTPCSLKLKTKRNFTVDFSKPEHNSYITTKGRGAEKDGVLTFHAKLESMKARREKRELENARCAAMNLQPKGGEIDRNAKPLVKIQIKKPDEVIENGLCKLRFDVNTEGTAENIDVLECSNPLLAKLSTAIIPKWRYVNSRVDGCPIPKSGVETTIEFN